GNTSNLDEAWKKTEAYMQENNYVAAPESSKFEFYIVGPEDTPNPAEWVTELYLPVQVEELPSGSL
ncbi:MAG: AraC family transcriptional regulator, partial [Leeuwenhoekiella sp.]|nr:AraC family transcriptional regulator [Leeuwenhoekiella sp.]